MESTEKMDKLTSNMMEINYHNLGPGKHFQDLAGTWWIHRAGAATDGAVKK